MRRRVDLAGRHRRHRRDGLREQHRDRERRSGVVIDELERDQQRDQQRIERGGGAVASLAECPTQGEGAILTAGPCHTLTPVEAGAGAMGVNADVPQYALEPSGAAKGALVVYLNASLSSPAMQIADPQKNFYNAAEQAELPRAGDCLSQQQRDCPPLWG